MKWTIRLCVTLLCIFGATLVAQADSSAETTTTVTVHDEVRLSNVKRLGINIGARDQYGAGQYLKNLVPNPGFEASEYNMVFNLESHQNGTTFVADLWDTSWNNDPLNIGQPEGFWDGAEFYFLTGEPGIFGRDGLISSFTHANDRYTFTTNDGGRWPEALDALAVRTVVDGYEGDLNAYRVGDTATTRPGSPGSQSLKLTTTGNWSPSYVEYFDSYGRDADTSAGKLYLVNGSWHFEIWAKAQTPGDRLYVAFQRIGEGSFLNTSFILDDAWQKFEYDFSVAETQDLIDAARNADGTSNPLALELRLDPSADPVWVDDVILQRSDGSNPTVFTDDFVTLLTELQPGILRDWGDQLGSSLDNQLAEPFARKLTGVSPKQRVGYNYHYSLHEFLELCAFVDAEPWYVIPTGFTPEEMENLAAYLAAPVGEHPYADKRAALGRTAPWTDAFDTIHLEFGNEIWGNNQGTDPFLGATVRGGERASTLASLRFGQFKDSPFVTDLSQFNLTIGGQTFYPQRQHQLEMFGTEHDSIGLAPYFGSLDQYESAEAMFLPLYAHAQETVQAGSQVLQSKGYIDSFGQGTELSIYEVNLHAVTGDAPIDTRNDFLAGLGGGLALPLTMLSYQSELGIRNQAAYQALQFSRQLSNGDFARLFGLLRDTGATNAKRPTWLGLEMANRAIQGDLLETSQSGLNPNFRESDADVPYVQSYAYRDGSSYALILFNLHLSEQQTVQTMLPSPANGVATMHVLSAESLYSNNEVTQDVTIATTQLTNFASGQTFDLPAHSMTVIEWSNSTVVPTAVTLTHVEATGLKVLLPVLFLGLLSLTYFSRQIRRI